MDEKLKENLEKALNSGKDALVNLKEIMKNITKEMVANTKDESDEVKNNANTLFKDVVGNLKSLGKGSFEYLKAATKGINEGLKESGKADNNLLKGLGSSMLDSIKNLGSAGAFVTKETAKNLGSVIENLFKKDKDSTDDKSSDNSGKNKKK